MEYVFTIFAVPMVVFWAFSAFCLLAAAVWLVLDFTEGDRDFLCRKPAKAAVISALLSLPFAAVCYLLKTWG